MPNLTTCSQKIPPDPHDPEVLFCVASGRSVAGKDKHGRRGIVVVVVDVGGVLVNAISTAYQLQVDTTNEDGEGGERSGGAGGTLVLFRQVARTNEILGQTEHELTIDRNLTSMLAWDTHRV